MFGVEGLYAGGLASLCSGLSDLMLGVDCTYARG